jgi:hypothetical protein
MYCIYSEHVIKLLAIEFFLKSAFDARIKYRLSFIGGA